MAKKINILKELEKQEKKAHLIVDDLNSKIKEETIGIKLDSAQQIFNPLDPSPLESRSLGKDFEEYCLEQLEHVSFPSRLRLKVYVSSGLDFNAQDEEHKGLLLTEENKKAITQAFENHFKNRAKEQLVKNTRESRKWRLNLLVGLLVMAACLVAAHILGLPRFEGMPLTHAISESLGILGWVAIWEPAEFFLFGWRDNTNDLQKFMRLHRATLEFCPAQKL